MRSKRRSEVALRTNAAVCATHAPGHWSSPCTSGSRHRSASSHASPIRAAAIHYALSLWNAMVRYLDDGRIEIDNSAAERALRGLAVGRRNYLFAGSDRGGERAAVFYTLIGSAKLNGLDPEAYLQHVLT